MNDGTAISVVGPAFLQKWSHPLITLDDLFFIVQTTMPKNKAATRCRRPTTQPSPRICSSRTGTRRERNHAWPLKISAKRCASPPPAASRQRQFHSRTRRRETVDDRAGPGGARRRGDGRERVARTTRRTTTARAPRRRRRSRRPTRDRLQVVCAFQMGETSNFQTGPLVYDGTMYLTTTHVTAAVDATTCKLRWRHVWAPRARELVAHQSRRRTEGRPRLPRHVRRLPRGARRVNRPDALGASDRRRRRRAKR